MQIYSYYAVICLVNIFFVSCLLFVPFSCFWLCFPFPPLRLAVPVPVPVPVPFWPLFLFLFLSLSLSLFDSFGSFGSVQLREEQSLRISLLFFCRRFGI
jgi:hypothetical protein